MKRYSLWLFLFVFLFSFNLDVFAEGVYKINNFSNNSVQISTSNINVKTKIMVEKGKEKYYYNMNNKNETVPLQLGNGTYTVKVLEIISGKKYKVVQKKDILLNNETLNDVYLASNQPVYWNNQKNTIALGEKITQGLNSKEEKVKAVYNYVTENIKYDHNQINNIDNTYVPELDRVLSTNKGICYDYSSLFAGILRSQGIHSKLLMGYKNDLDVYHAWNEVFLDGKWVVIDTTYDAAYKASKKEVNMIKSHNDYKISRVY